MAEGWAPRGWGLIDKFFFPVPADFSPKRPNGSELTGNGTANSREPTDKEGPDDLGPDRFVDQHP
jgi:hypothetical protein